MHAAIQQQLVSGMIPRRNKGSVSSLEGGRIFNDAVGWISQQKVRSLYCIGCSVSLKKKKNPFQ